MLRACLALPLLVAAVTSNTFQYVKVDSSFPDSIASCLLSSSTFPPSGNSTSPLRIRCGAVCSHTPYCTLFCIRGTTCDTFRAKATLAWVGSGTGSFLYDKCYSIHPTLGDVALGASTASSSVYNSNYDSFPTSANFFCMTEAACYESLIDNPPWWMADLGIPRKVTRIRISLSALIDTNVEFRVGNDTSVTNNPKLLPTPTVTPYNGLELVADTPIVGRYFFVTEPHSSDIRICDVWVMTK